MGLVIKEHVPNLICLILASFGLFWQVYSVSEMFFGFQTRVDIEMEAPINLTMPAITICLPLDPHPKTLRKVFASRNLTLLQMRSEIYFLPINILSTLETSDVKVFCRTKYPRTIDETPDGQPCDLFGTTLHHMQHNMRTNLTIRCTTYLARSEDEEPLTVIANEAKDYYYLEIFSMKSNVVYIYIHNPIEILNLPESDFFMVFTNQSSSIVTSTSRLTVNLPSNTFPTNCVSYNDVPFSRLGCIFNCRQKVAKSTCGSWSTDVPAPLNTKLSFRSHQRNCPHLEDYDCIASNVCPVSCKAYWYTTSLVWNHMKESKSNLTKFYVRRPYGLEFVYNVTPNLAPIEYSCYVASCLGIWFGISFSDAMIRIFSVINETAEKKEKSRFTSSKGRNRGHNVPSNRVNNWFKPEYHFDINILF